MSPVADSTSGNRRSLMDVYETTVVLRLLIAFILTHGSKSKCDFQVSYLANTFHDHSYQKWWSSVYIGKVD